MKITYILPSYPRRPTGGYKVVYEYANALCERGHEVSVIHPYGVEPYLPEPPKDLVLLKNLWRRVLRWKNARPVSTQSWQPIDSRVKMEFLKGEPLPESLPDADVLIATGWQTAKYVWQAPLTKGKKLHHVADYEIWLTCDSETKDLMRQAFRLPLFKLSISSSASKMLKESASHEKPAHILHGLNHDVYYEQVSPEQRSPITVGMPYRTAKKKGMDDGFKALRAVKEKIPDLRAFLFGSEAVQHELDPWMTYYYRPSNQEVADLYNSVAVFVVPSIAEGFGLPALEAMACGAAVCSTDTGGVNDYATHGVNALVSPPQVPEALARNIIRLIQDDELRHRLAHAGRAQAANFTWSRAAERLEAILQSSLKPQHD